MTVGGVAAAELLREARRRAGLTQQAGTDSLPPSPLAERLLARRLAVVETAARYGAHDVRLFGSVARGEDGPHSDIDLLVTLSPGTGMLALAGLQRDLERVLEAPVDVIPDDGVKARLWQRMQRELVAL